jgi:hypothetical protein
MISLAAIRITGSRHLALELALGLQAQGLPLAGSVVVVVVVVDSHEVNSAAVMRLREKYLPKSSLIGFSAAAAADFPWAAVSVLSVRYKMRNIYVCALSKLIK